MDRIHLGTLFFLVSPCVAFLYHAGVFRPVEKALTASAVAKEAAEYNEERIVTQAMNWCGLNSLLYTDGYYNYSHAPVALVPNTFSRAQFEFAESLQPIFNELVDNMARDRSFIVESLSAVAKVDEFTKRLLDIFATVPDKVVKDSVHLGIHRSDYMFHGNEDGSETLLQIEINTISASFACLSNRVGDLHRYLLQRNSGSATMQQYMQSASPSFAQDLNTATASIPENPSIRTIALGISIAHILYGDAAARVLFIVQPNEKNVADQRLLEAELFRVHGIPVEFLTLAQVASRAKITDTNTLSILPENGASYVPVSVAYFRSGYAPTDYHSEVEWDARKLIERSSAIKCPTVAYQLVGTKKIQQTLCVPGVLERFLTADKAKTLRKCFAAQYSLGSMATPEAHKAVESAITGNGAQWVLKPQREGGGNNFYGEELVKFLREHKDSDVLSGYVLMQRIFPKPQTSVCLKKGKVSTVPSISELGIYGVFIGDGSSDITPMLNQYAGYLLRTKPLGVDEGGVATGYSVLSSVLLEGKSTKAVAAEYSQEDEESIDVDAENLE